MAKRLPEIKLRCSKEKADRIKHFLVQRDKFLNHTGLIAEGHFCIGFDPGYLFGRPQGPSYDIPADIMDRIIATFEDGIR